jgi:hypothetical protein
VSWSTPVWEEADGRLGIKGSYFCDQDCFKKNCKLASRVVSHDLMNRGMLNTSDIGRGTHTDQQGSHKMIHNIVQMSAEAQTASKLSYPCKVRADKQKTAPCQQTCETTNSQEQCVPSTHYQRNEVYPTILRNQITQITPKGGLNASPSVRRQSRSSPKKRLRE